MVSLRLMIFLFVLLATLVTCNPISYDDDESIANSDEENSCEEYTNEWHNEKACNETIDELVEKYVEVFGLKESQVRKLLAEETKDSSEKRRKRTITYDIFHLVHKKLWANATVVYAFVEDMTEENKTKCKEAMQILSEVSCLKFVERTNEKNYVKFMETEPDSNKTHVCRSAYFSDDKGVQELEMRDCEGTSDIVHELLHSLGFVHEHSRPDRDKYVEVEWCKIPEEDREQYCKLPELFAGEYDTPYDYKSLLHYDDEFLIIKDSSIESISKPTKLSDTDVRKINELYCNN